MSGIRIGIDVGGTNIEACALDFASYGKEDIKYVHRAYPKGASCEKLCNVLTDCMQELLVLCDKEKQDIVSVGIATPGSVDILQGLIIHAYNLDLHDAHIIENMQSCTPGVRFSLINDADAATLGEFKLGALCGVSSGCMLTLGTGVGAGLIINGGLYRGGKMRGTELGHVILNMNGDECSCGNRGCIETLCSATALAKTGKAAFHDERMTAKDITDLAKKGDKKAMAVFDSYIDALASAIASYMALLDPERVVIGGGVSLAGDILFDKLRERTRKKCFFDPIGEIIPATLGNKAGAIGAAFAE